MSPTSSRNVSPAIVASEPTKERDANGQCAQGDTVAHPGKAMLAMATLNDVAEVFQALLTRAKSGNIQAMRLFLAYAVGKPEKLHESAGGIVLEAPLPNDPALPRVFPTETPITDGAGTVEPSPDGFCAPAQPDAPTVPTTATTPLVAKPCKSEPPSTNGPAGELEERMAELYDTFVKRGYARPLAGKPEVTPRESGLFPAESERRRAVPTRGDCA